MNRYAEEPAEGEAIRTATYTDPTTGWAQVVEVLGDVAPSAGVQLSRSRVRNTHYEQAEVPNTMLSDFHDEPPFLAPEEPAAEQSSDEAGR